MYICMCVYMYMYTYICLFIHKTKKNITYTMLLFFTIYRAAAYYRWEHQMGSY